MIAINIDTCVKDLNIHNHDMLADILLFAKLRSIDIHEKDILTFYFSNFKILYDENSKKSLNLFIQLLNENKKLIDGPKLQMLFDLFSEQSFEYKNEMIFILADLYLLHKDIFSKNLFFLSPVTISIIRCSPKNNKR